MRVGLRRRRDALGRGGLLWYTEEEPACSCGLVVFMILLLIQMAAVMLVTLTCGWIARKVGQSRVIGEIIGGILLGPSVLGRIAPHGSAVLFPQSSFASFEMLSTVGLILFLFLIYREIERGPEPANSPAGGAH